MGTLTPAQVDAIMDKYDKDHEKGVILADINNPNQSVREDTIKQLSNGGGTLDHSALNGERTGAAIHTRC